MVPVARCRQRYAISRAGGARPVSHAKMVGMRRLDFHQVDVFAPRPLAGNPVAVVHGAERLSSEDMLAFARWANLSETIFLLPVTDDRADYQVRIFTPKTELPFAGHPTLGAAHAWLEAGGVAKGDSIVQQCGVGLIEIRRDGELLSFSAPDLRVDRPVDAVTIARAASALGISVYDVVHARHMDNGPEWVAIMMSEADKVLRIVPDMTAMGELWIGVIGPHPEGGPADFEVRAFEPATVTGEDPVTGSLNAALGQWLIGAGLAPRRYSVRQGTAMGRDGDVHIAADDDDQVWVGGRCLTVVTGSVTI